MHTPVRRLQREMGSAEFAEYLALERIEPWVARPIGHLPAQALAPRRRQSAEEMTAIFRRAAVLHNQAEAAKRDHAR